MKATCAPAYDVVCLGTCCWDTLGICEEWPQLDQKRPLLALEEQGGGPAATAAAAIARLGGRVAFIGRVGDDDYGRKIREAFEHVGVDASWGLQVIPSARSQWAFCVAHKATGLRAILWRPPATGTIAPEELDYDRASNARVVLVDTHHLAAATALVQRCRELGIPTVADIEHLGEHTAQLLRLVDYPILPQDCALNWSGEQSCEAAAAAIAKQAGGVAVVTMGARGSVACDTSGEIVYQPAFEVQPVVDTTGAGDVYHGAFAFGLARRMALPDAMRFASATAALSCQALGGRAGLPTLDQVQALLRRGERLPERLPGGD
ncbi:MAG: PfkB family carbohydrate kinase [Armatimonadetes bacterium]|nr:PfkB family carbohydrate kinase [Armatimonadota bacterium]